MSKDKGKDKDTTTPKAKGGRRGKNPNSRKGMANLRPWRAGGPSPNPSGRSKSVVQLMQEAREMVPGALQRLNEVLHDRDTPPRDVISAAVAICDRGLGKPPIGIFHGNSATSPLDIGEDGEEVSALIRAARASPNERALADLRAEADRIEKKLAEAEQDHEMRLTQAAEAQARGEPIDGLTALLLSARAANASRRQAPPPPPPAAESAGHSQTHEAPILTAARPDFIVDPFGQTRATEPRPAPAPEDAPQAAPKAAWTEEPAPEAPKAAAPKSPPFRVPPDPKPAPKPKPNYRGAPAAFRQAMESRGEFLSVKETADRDAAIARLQEEARKNPTKYPGGQVPQAEINALFPDPRDPPEVVNYTRIAGGKGIRRC